VDAITPRSNENALVECAENAEREQLSGREMDLSAWQETIIKLLQIDPEMEFDLSGGDCLALPWVRDKLIPFIIGKVKDAQRVSVTATAASVEKWLESIALSKSMPVLGSIHITYDGYRDYSNTNLNLVKPLHDLGIDVHVECPITKENCSVETATKIYTVLKDHNISEILLMRYFPVGRGGVSHGKSSIWEPTVDEYKTTVNKFLELAEKYPEGPKVKLQCSLKEFTLEGANRILCKMGHTTWCIMPNGNVLICPWAYGLNGAALDTGFVAGNIRFDCIDSLTLRADELVKKQYQENLGSCKIIDFCHNVYNQMIHNDSPTHIKEALIGSAFIPQRPTQSAHSKHFDVAISKDCDIQASREESLDIRTSRSTL